MLMSGLVMLGSQAAGWVRSGRAARHRRRSARVARQPEILLPAGVDVRRLLEAACEQFVRLQAAWDAADLGTLAALTTFEMFDELRAELPQRGALPNRTEVLSVQANLLGFDDFGSVWLASIEFSGVIREAPERDAMPFRELWLLTRERAAADATPPAASWRLARQQALL